MICRLFFVGSLLLLPLTVLPASPAHAASWLPTSATPLALHWVLGDPLNVNDPVQMGLRDFNGNVLPAPDVYDIDGETNTTGTVTYLHSLGKHVICYIDAGVYENYRSDASRFPASVIGSKDGSWAGSWWLDIRQLGILGPIMQDRIAMCASKGFDAVEPDEIDGWENSSGFPLTYNDQLTYNRAVAGWIHAAGLTAIQKGDIIQTRDLVDYFDATLNEECFQYNECSNPWNPTTGQTQIGLQAYTAQNKAVWVAEYKKYTTRRWSSICATSATQHWNTARYALGLPNTGGRLPCKGW